jgi:hypothetical protein
MYAAYKGNFTKRKKDSTHIRYEMEDSKNNHINSHPQNDIEDKMGREPEKDNHVPKDQENETRTSIL